MTNTENLYEEIVSFRTAEVKRIAAEAGSEREASSQFPSCTRDSEQVFAALRYITITGRSYQLKDKACKWGVEKDNKNECKSPSKKVIMWSKRSSDFRQR